jgi:hypothetical protein
VFGGAAPGLLSPKLLPGFPSTPSPPDPRAVSKKKPGPYETPEKLLVIGVLYHDQVPFGVHEGATTPCVTVVVGNATKVDKSHPGPNVGITP